MIAITHKHSSHTADRTIKHNGLRVYSPHDLDNEVVIKERNTVYSIQSKSWTILLNLGVLIALTPKGSTTFRYKVLIVYRHIMLTWF